MAPLLKPPEPLELSVEGAEDGEADDEGTTVDAGLTLGRGDSAGKGSPIYTSATASLHVMRRNLPGCNIYAESMANVLCLSMLILLLRLMPPTIPYVIQLPGAEQ